MATKAWFNYSTYMNNKLAQMQELDSTYTMTKLKTAFDQAGFTGDEGAQAHFLKYGHNEDVSPNQYFNADYYYKAKAIQYYTSEAGGSHAESEVRVNLAQYAQNVEGLIRAAGMDAWTHYTKYGTSEGINPSDGFNTSAYMQAKFAAWSATSEGSGKTIEDMYKAFKSANLNALAHAMQYGGDSTSTATGEVQVWSDTGHTAIVDAYDSNDDNIGQTAVTKSLTTAVETVNGNTNMVVDGIWDHRSAQIDMSTYNNGDVINTAKEVDIELVSTTGNETATATLNDVTDFNIKTLVANAFTVNAAGFTNVANMNVAASTVRSDITFTNADLASTVSLNNNAKTNNATSEVSVTYRSSQTSGTSDKANLAANNGIGTITMDNTVEQISFTGTGSNTVTLNENGAANVNTLYVAGAGNNTITIDALTKVKMLDMSASTGTNNVHVDELPSKVEIIGGSGEDTVTTGNSDLTRVTMSGVENLGFTSDATPTAVSVDFAKVEDLKGVIVNGTTTAGATGVQNTVKKAGALTDLTFSGTGKASDAQYFEGIKFAQSFTGSDETLAIAINNDGTALNAGKNFTVGDLDLTGVEKASITVSDDTADNAETTVGDIVTTTMTELKATANGSLTLGTVGTLDAAKIATVDFSGVEGESTVRFANAVFAEAATIKGSADAMNLTLGTAKAATNTMTITGYDGDDTFNLATYTGKVTIDAGKGDNTITAAAGPNTINVTGGANTIDLAASAGQNDKIVYADAGLGGTARSANDATRSLDDGNVAAVTSFVGGTEDKIDVSAFLSGTAAPATTDHWVFGSGNGQGELAVFNAVGWTGSEKANAVTAQIGKITMSEGDTGWAVVQNGTSSWIYEVVAGANHDGTDTLGSADTVSLVGEVTNTVLAAGDFVLG